MKKFFLATLLFNLYVYAQAAELAGVKLTDSVHVGSRDLQLNGAGVRSRFFFDLYIAALYLPGKSASFAAVLADGGAKRIALHVVAGESEAERFLHGFRNGIEKNQGEQELAALRERMNAFDQLFGAVKTFKKGDVIAFDWLPGSGTHISLNGAELGRIAGEDFYRALLSIWIGEKPVSGDLKKGLLGG